MKVLLISTYELGHQPLHVAAPAAEIRAAGHEVAALDLAVDSWDPSCLSGVEAVAVSVPMHTAMRMAIEVGERVKRHDPDLPVAFYGLYAGVGQQRTLGSVADRLIAGEYEDALVEWLDQLGTARAGNGHSGNGHSGNSHSGNGHSGGVSVDIGRRKFRLPARDILPPPDRYAHLATGNGHRVVGYVEASHGCRHRCTHCPVPAVYDGRYRITGAETVLADIDQLVAAGVGHISFGDPDFLNAPAYAVGVVEAAHGRHPDLSFDITVKVEHILRHRHLWPDLAAAGVIYVVSAVESLDETILGYLDKGHTGADAGEAVEIVRSAGIDMHPTWLPFTPWTTPETIADIARFVWRHDLAAVTDPVQMSIRLLIPDGSVMLGVDALTPHVTGYDAAALGYTWRAADPAMDELQAVLARMAEESAEDESPQVNTLVAMTEVISAVSGIDVPMVPGVATFDGDRPRMSEPWFCCAEPTSTQLGVLGGAQVSD